MMTRNNSVDPTHIPNPYTLTLIPNPKTNPNRNPNPNPNCDPNPNSNLNTFMTKGGS